MKNKIIRIFLLIIISSFMSIYQVNASNVVDFSKLGSIEITLSDRDNENIKGAEITLYHIANATNKDHNLSLEYTSNYEMCGVELTNINDEILIDALEQCTKEKESNLKQVTNEEGKVKFENLKLGLYLVKQTNQVKGYSTIDSFLIILPVLENDSWEYNIMANPKTEVYKTMDITVSKVWNDKDNNINNVVVGLYKDNKLIEKAELNEENKWQYTWMDVEKSDKYQVKELDIPNGYTATYRKIDNNFIVTNTKSLAQTGQRTWIINLLSVISFLLIISGVIIEKKSNHE